MLLIRPKRPPPFKRGYSFSLSDLIKRVMLMPVLTLLAMAKVFLDEFIAVLVIAIPGIIVALILANGNPREAWEIIKENWEMPVYSMLLIFTIMKLIRGSNKRYD